MSKLTTLIFILAVNLISFQLSTAQESDLETIKITDNIYMLKGNGGNIGVSVGEDGVFMIDDQFAASNPAILAAIAKITDKPVKFLINTHWHPDHTGGNELMGEAGSIIVAHDNVRKTLSEEQFSEFFNRTLEPLNEKGLPVITFTEAVTFHFNGDEIYIFHTAPSHTNGDAAVYFKNANVLHSGDVVFKGRYPIIDIERDGSAEGYTTAIDELLKIVNDQTKIIPGHGPLCDIQHLKNFRTMMSTVTARVKAMKGEGKTLDEVVAAKPSADFDEEYKGAVEPDGFIWMVYKSLK